MSLKGNERNSDSGIMTAQNVNAWTKAQFATTYLKDSIFDGIDETLKQQHHKMLSEIKAEFNTVKHECTCCSISTLLPAHTRDNDRCPLGQKNCNCLNVQGKKICPTMFCSAMYDKIITQHRFKSPNWSNTDIKQWYSNYWEMAKCYITGNDLRAISSAKETECLDLLNVSICNNAVVGASQEQAVDTISKIRDALNKMLNLPNMEVNENTLNEYINDMTVVLNKNWLCSKHKADAVLNKLIQLRDGKVPRDKEKSKVNSLKEAAAAILSAEEISRSSSDSLNAVLSGKCSENDELKGRMDKMEERQSFFEKRQTEIENSLKQIRMNSGKSKTDQQNQSVSTKEGTSTASLVSKKRSNDSLTEFKMPTINCPHDGRLILLNHEEVEGVMRHCHTKVLQGGFGDVHISKYKVPGLDVRVVIKKITCDVCDQIKMFSTSSEKIAARVMHFAVVPLIAYMDRIEDTERVFYFLSPYLENGNLLGIIAKDKACSDIKSIQLASQRRIQILFQIASAIDYLHTPIPGYRGIVLHMDLTTTNIVLDKNTNARLIDFGLAREMNEGQREVSYTQSRAFGTPGYYPTFRYSQLTVNEDYYNFGVVIREMLTGKAPYIKCGNEADELRKSSEEVIRKTLQKNVWNCSKQNASALIKLSKRCLDSRKDKKLSSASIVKELKKMRWNTPTRQTYDKCTICMVNVAVEAGKSPSHPCGIQICVSCMRNSHINPIKCPSCNGDVVPEIGHTFAALLIAGNDLKNSALAKSFSYDVEEIRDVLASKYPCVIGISNENIKMVTPSTPGQAEKLLPQLSAAFDFLHSRKNVGTLLFYFTGHHLSKSGFVLGGPDDILTLAKIQEDLVNLCKTWKNTTRILVFLDCCKAPNMGTVPELSNACVKMIQVNACRPYETCSQAVSGSAFQKFFVQALTRKMFNKECFNTDSSEKENECKDCKMSGDFISVERLLEYISNHMKKCSYGQDPVLYMQGITWRDASIGYNVDFVVRFNFKFEVEPGKTVDVEIDHGMYCDINKLKEHILQKVLNERETHLLLTPVEFADAISLRVHTGQSNGEELRSMLNVSAAMNTKREIIASYRMVSYILNGRVVLFIPTQSFSRYLENRNLLRDVDERRKMAKLSLKELDHVTDEINEDREFEEVHRHLLKVYTAWKNEKNTGRKQLKIIFPCITDDDHNDFSVLDLSVRPGITLQCLNKIACSTVKTHLYLVLLVFVLIAALVLYI